MPQNIGPGPGAYKLPTQVGYRDHDTTKYRNPMYSMRCKCAPGVGFGTPGPQYDISQVTRYGRITSKAYTAGMKLAPGVGLNTPGPGAYAPENVPRMKEARPPAYTMGRKFAPGAQFGTPGPNQYVLPPMLGPKLPTKKAYAAYTMSPKNEQKGCSRSPGPAEYGATSNDLIKKRAPKYSMRCKCEPGVGQGSPGPAAYFPQIKAPIPGGLTMGKLFDKAPYITCDDHLPCL
ncbi:hypothetical protein FQR65_LT05869 [Abscondita terminalis]|nr:hypothetical protein FQR65_LT05869 [Abscondita terminalis]